MSHTRRQFVHTAASALALGATSLRPLRREIAADVAIIGGGTGGCAAAIAALRNGLRVVMTEQSDWIGGQFTSQAVPPDEHRWIETHGANQSYRDLRQRVRDYYRANYALTDAARANATLNPGNGSVSRLCCEPHVWLAVLEEWLAPFIQSGQLTLLTETVPTAADVDGDHVRAVTLKSLATGDVTTLVTPWFVDATELGDLLPLTGTEFVTGSESKQQTQELHAAEVAAPDNHQAFTVCFALGHHAGENHVIDKPEQYSLWRDYVPKLTPPWPGRLLDLTYTHPSTLMPKRLGFDPQGGSSVNGSLNLWIYRRIIDASLFEPGQFQSDISLINWPQNDYVEGNLFGDGPEAAKQHLERARQLSLSLLYWLQTEAPRPDGGTGFPGLRLRPDLMGTADGLAKMPYVREARRIRARFTVTEAHVGKTNRSQVTGVPEDQVRAAEFSDSVGVGSYHIDLHPSSGGDNYIDFASLPFQIPLGALLPVRMNNLLPACKNIGTTHVTNGCYRLHPVEWGIGEAVGCLVKFAVERNTTPNAVHENPVLLQQFQAMLQLQGVEIRWP